MGPVVRPDVCPPVYFLCHRLVCVALSSPFHGAGVALVCVGLYQGCLHIVSLEVPLWMGSRQEHIGEGRSIGDCQGRT